MNKTLYLVFKIWVFGLGAIFAIAFTYAIIQTILGNYTGTASFEF